MRMMLGGEECAAKCWHEENVITLEKSVMTSVTRYLEIIFIKQQVRLGSDSFTFFGFEPQIAQIIADVSAPLPPLQGTKIFQ